jgi:hypothetical protein
MLNCIFLFQQRLKLENVKLKKEIEDNYLEMKQLQSCLDASGLAEELNRLREENTNLKANGYIFVCSTSTLVYLNISIISIILNFNLT